MTKKIFKTNHMGKYEEGIEYERVDNTTIDR